MIAPAATAFRLVERMRDAGRPQLRFIASLLLLILAAPAAAQPPRWETFGDWQVAAVHDDMDPTSHVILRTTMQVEGERSYLRPTYEIGFRVFGGILIALDPDIQMPGRNSWPSCDFDLSSYRLDGQPVRYLADVDDGGSCNHVSQSVIRDFMRGRAARLRLNGVDGSISLRGFSAAWNRARQLARN